MSVLGELAFDASVRTTDGFGHLRLSKSHISKATVNPYYGMEIPRFAELGLDPQKVYYLFRDPLELARAASTFATKPILSRHVPVSAAAPSQHLIIGSIGSDIEFTEPYLDADLCFWDATAIAGIETDTVRELSAAYSYVAVMTPGEYHGQRYDGIMTEIRGNHLALVESGRAGSDVLAADEAIKTMKTTKLGNALFVTLSGMSPKLAADSSLATLVGQAVAKTFNREDVSTKLIALDATLDPKKLSTTFDAMLALDAAKPECAEDEDDEEEKEKKKIAADAEKEEKDAQMAKDAEEKAEKKLEGAMDSFRKELRDTEDARRAVRPVVGEVIAQDSAEGIYGFALDEMKVSRKDVTGVAALKALFDLAHSSRSAAPAPGVIAQDSATVAAKFPNATRFKQF